MKHKRFLFLLTAAVAFIIQLIDIISYTIKFSITQTFVLVIIQMIGLVGYAYDARNVVKNKRRMFTILHSIAFISTLFSLFLIYDYRSRMYSVYRKGWISRYR